jgi:hypothetical protein
MRPIRQIIIHCSDSDFGDANAIDSWHKQRGWKGIGYHYVITNGVITHGSAYDADMDGGIQNGRPEETIGAHCQGHNSDSLGICLIGVRHFTAHQFETLTRMLRSLCAKHSIPFENIHGHREYDSGKTCPNFDVRWTRELLKGGK